MLRRKGDNIIYSQHQIDVELNKIAFLQKKYSSRQRSFPLRSTLLLAAVFLGVYRLLLLEGKATNDRALFSNKFETHATFALRTKARPIIEVTMHPQQVRYESESGLVESVREAELPVVPRTRAKRVSQLLQWDKTDPNDDYGEDGCEFMNPNYSQLYLSCPPMHEIDMKQMSFINCGGTRCAFHLPDSDPSRNERVVLKMIG